MFFLQEIPRIVIFVVINIELRNVDEAIIISGTVLEKGIANILPLSKMKEKYRVTYNSQADNAFIVHKLNGSKNRFTETVRGLYAYDTGKTPLVNKINNYIPLFNYSNILYSDLSNSLLKPTSKEGISLVNTVKNNLKNHIKRNQKQAKLVRRIQIIARRPEIKEFVSNLDTNKIKNFPVEGSDALAAYKICGRDVGVIKGKTVQKNSVHAKSCTMNIPRGIIDKYCAITLRINNMFVNGVKKNLPIPVTSDSLRLKTLTAGKKNLSGRR